MVEKGDIGLTSIGLKKSKKVTLTKPKLSTKWLLFSTTPLKNRHPTKFNTKTRIESIYSKKGNLSRTESSSMKKGIINFLFLTLMLFKSGSIALKFREIPNLQEQLLTQGLTKTLKKPILCLELFH